MTKQELLEKEQAELKQLAEEIKEYEKNKKKEKQNETRVGRT